MGSEKGTRAEQVMVGLRGLDLEGELAIPENSVGLVLFAHGSGSSRHSPRNQFVAGQLRRKKLGTLLFDLLTRDEEQRDERTGELRFDINLLAERLAGASAWVKQQSPRLPLGYFGSSTGAAAALVAAARPENPVSAIVSRGGRPDLAGPALAQVKAATLLIVGSEDKPVVGLNQDAYRQLKCRKELRIVPGATHLFEEPGKLEQVAEIAGSWFEQCFGTTLEDPND